MPALSLHAPSPLSGVLPVFQTPFHDDESIDFDTLAGEIDWLYEQGADGLVMAMVSEVLRLSTDEREQVAAFVCECNTDRGAVVISVGAESGHTAERLARQAEAAGADAVMAIPPVSVALDEAELTAYYKRIIHAISLPVIVQDASGYVGRPMSIGLQAGLLDRHPERVLFKPEAVPLGPRLTELREATAGRSRVFEGSGGIALVDSFRRGVVGTMPGADLIKPLVALWRALQADDQPRADAIAFPLASLVSIQHSLDAFLAIEKHLLVRQGIFRNTIVRSPVGYRLDEETVSEVDRLFDILLSVVDNNSP
jgi:dihydrodipicolinate synthase/N-acetylneuraminate lyase